MLPPKKCTQKLMHEFSGKIEERKIAKICAIQLTDTTSRQTENYADTLKQQSLVSFFFFLCCDGSLLSLLVIWHVVLLFA